MQFMNCLYSFLKNSNNDGIRKPVDAIHELHLQRANVAIVIAKFFKKLKCYNAIDQIFKWRLFYMAKVELIVPDKLSKIDPDLRDRLLAGTIREVASAQLREKE